MSVKVRVIRDTLVGAGFVLATTAKIMTKESLWSTHSPHPSMMLARV